MDEVYDEIIAFAELQDFQDRAFKQLSSGMKSRLAFSIACLVNPDILILDEVLSVDVYKRQHVFFKDIQYLYSIFTMLVMYGSAIFYNINTFPPEIQMLFKFNPIYDFILYFRTVVIDGAVPSLMIHLALLISAAGAVSYTHLGIHKWKYLR